MVEINLTHSKHLVMVFREFCWTEMTQFFAGIAGGHYSLDSAKQTVIPVSDSRTTATTRNNSLIFPFSRQKFSLGRKKMHPDENFFSRTKNKRRFDQKTNPRKLSSPKFSSQWCGKSKSGFWKCCFAGIKCPFQTTTDLRRHERGMAGLRVTRRLSRCLALHYSDLSSVKCARHGPGGWPPSMRGERNEQAHQEDLNLETNSPTDGWRGGSGVKSNKEESARRRGHLQTFFI